MLGIVRYSRAQAGKDADKGAAYSVLSVYGECRPYTNRECPVGPSLPEIISLFKFPGNKRDIIPDQYLMRARSEEETVGLTAAGSRDKVARNQTTGPYGGD